MSDCRCELPENTERMEQTHLCFAELLPSANVVWTLTSKDESLYVVKHHSLGREIQKIGVVGFCKLADEPLHHFWVGQGYPRYVDQRQKFKLLLFFAPLDYNFSVVTRGVEDVWVPTKNFGNVHDFLVLLIDHRKVLRVVEVRIVILCQNCLIKQ